MESRSPRNAPVPDEINSLDQAIPEQSRARAMPPDLSKALLPPSSPYMPVVPPGAKPTTALQLVAMRAAILGRVDVIQNWIDVANGVMPERWEAALNPKDERGNPKKFKRGLVLADGTIGEEEYIGQPVMLNLENIMWANLQLLKRILPEYRQVEVSSGGGGQTYEYPQAVEALSTLITTAVISKGGRIESDGRIVLPDDGETITQEGEHVDDAAVARGEEK